MSKKLASRKLKKKHYVFFKVFDSLGVQVGVLGAMLADVGFKLGVFGSSWHPRGASRRHVESFIADLDGILETS